MTKMVPYSSFPYADHALRQVGVENPNTPAEATDEHIDFLIAAANALRTMVKEMENLEDIKGFITYNQEEAKEITPAQQMIKTGDDAEEENKVNELEQLTQEVAQKILTVDGEDIIEKFKGKVLKEFLPCELLAANANDLYMDYYDFDQCVDEYFSQSEK